MKFEKTDKEYKTRRKAFSEKYGKRELWSVIDHWQLYCGISNMARSLAIADILRSTLNVPGHVAEFGSWRGANLMYLAKLIRIYDPLSPKQVHCFEGFEGLSTFTPQDGKDKDRGRYKGSYQELLDAIKLYDMKDEVLIHKGLVKDTLSSVLSAQPDLTFSFIYCDVDLYEPTKLILDQMDERLSEGGVFVIDEYCYDNFPGETVAVREFLASTKSSYKMESVRNTRQPSLVLRKE